MFPDDLDKHLFDSYNHDAERLLAMVCVRSVINFRLDSLFARVEALRNLELAGKPVVVGKSAGNSSGIVVSASPEARSLGVYEGLTVRHALRLCPEGILVSANFALYREYAHKAFDILAQYSPLVEPQSLGGAWVDVTGSSHLFGGVRKIAQEASIRIKGELGLETAVGIAGNKFLAEAAASAIGPGKAIEIVPGKERDFLAPLPVKFVWGIGEKTERRLADLRIRTIGQLSMIPERLLVRRFGPIGSSFHSLASGIDHSPVMPAYPLEIINIEQMFENELEEPDAVREYLPQMVDRLALELRKRGKLAEYITLKLMMPECEIAGCRLKRPVNSSNAILAAAGRLLGLAMRLGMKPAGMQIELSDLVMGEGIQLNLLGEGERTKQLDAALETIKEKFGEKAIFYGAALAASGKETVLSRVAA